jgi:hypothetical protein
LALGEKLVKIAEGVVDALGGLEALGIADEGCLDVARIFLFLNSEVIRTQMGVWSEAERRHWRPEGVKNSQRVESGEGLAACSFILVLHELLEVAPPPACFGAKSAEVTENKEIEFWRVPKSAEVIGSKGDR